MDPIFVPSSPEEGSETKRTEAHGRKKWIPFLSRLHPGGGGRKNEARRRRMVGVDALGDPSCANMKQKPCGFREAPALRALAGASPKNVSSFLCRGFVRALCFTTRRCSQTTRVLLCRFPQNFRYGNNISLPCRPFSAILEKKDKQRGKRP